jgi:hypothetical protein
VLKTGPISGIYCDLGGVLLVICRPASGLVDGIACPNTKRFDAVERVSLRRSVRTIIGGMRVFTE